MIQKVHWIIEGYDTKSLMKYNVYDTKSLLKCKNLWYKEFTEIYKGMIQRVHLIIYMIQRVY